jgi:Rrf2 family iron-sulfur cluster assembly transcriptional regulator
MRLSSKGRFAVTSMLSLALGEGGGPITLASLSIEQGISLSYLEQFFARLRKQGLVDGVRGPGGGYRLSRPAEEITMAEIIMAADDKSVVKKQENVVELYGKKRQTTDQMWADLCNRIETFLDDITLADLLQEHKEKNDHKNDKNAA